MESSLLTLRKPTGTIQLSNPFSLGERKLLNTLMYHAQTSGQPLGEEHEIPLEEVHRALGWTRSKNIEQLKEYLRSLVRTTIEWNEFGQDRKVDWQICTFLASGAIRGQRMRYMINPKIVSELRNPVLYAKVQLLVQGRLSKRHSLVLYEYFQDALGRRLSLDAVPLDFIVSLLGLSGETYLQWKYLQRDVIKPSIHEINRFTDLEVSYRPVRNGRQTVALDFDVARDGSFQLAFDLPATAPAALDDTVATIAALERLGVNRAAAESLCARHSTGRIGAHVTLLEGKLAEGTAIDNPGAWLRRAIEGNWADPGGDAPVAAPPTASPVGEAARPRVEEAFRSFRFRRARERFDVRSKTFRTRRRNAFIADMEREGNSTVLEAYRKGGWEQSMVAGCFLAHGSLMDDLLTEPHERDLDAFLAWQKRDGGSGGGAGA